MTYEEGTIIHGTHLASDLIPAFMRELPADHKLRREYEEHGYNEAEADELVCELIDALDELAPEGLYFGPLEGDGSDYGFWRVPTWT